MQRPKSLQLTQPSAASATTATAASPGVEAMEENEPVTSPTKADGNGGSNGEHVRTPTNDITNIAAAFPAAVAATAETATSTQAPLQPPPPTQPQQAAPMLLLPPPPPPLSLQPTSQVRRPARPSSLLLVTPAGQWAPPQQQPSPLAKPTSAAAVVAAPLSPASAMTATRQPQSRRPNSLCLPSKWTPAGDGGQPPQASATPVTPTPALPSPSPLGLRRPAPFPEPPPAIKRLRPSAGGAGGSGSSRGLALAFPPAPTFFTSGPAAATPSSELPPSPFPPPTPSGSLTLSSSSSLSAEFAAAAAAAGGVIEDAEMASPTASTASSSVSAGFQLGLSKPYWVPDRDAPLCMQCGARFTIMRRRHHCRACGRVLCSGCTGHSARLAFLGGARARVCAACHQQLTLPPPLPPPPPPPPPLPQRPPGGLKLASVQPQQQQPPQPSRSVVFSDGIRPGGGFNDPVALADSADGLEASLAPLDGSQLPPLCRRLPGDVNDDAATALAAGWTLTYQVCRSVRVSTRLLQSLPCCTPAGTAWWLLLSRGLFTVGQSEVFLLLQRASGESLPPAHAFALVYSMYERAFSGGWLRHLDYLPSPRRLGPLLGDRSHAGLLLFRPSRLHCTLHLQLPPVAITQPPLCGLLVLRWEAPWAELFPMRLLLRLGCEHRVYPCPLTSVRLRSPVFGELGRSLAGLLVDTRNFSHGLPSPGGLSVRLRTGCTTVGCPVDAYDSVQKALVAATAGAVASGSGGCGGGVGWVLAFGASFCSAADAHLVCYQNLETGEYGTRAISIESRQLSVTAASFVVFNGGGGAFARNRVSIVEDGVLVQLTDDQMARLRDALRSMRPWSAVCSAADSTGDLVEFVWTSRQDDEKDQKQKAVTEASEFSNADWWISLVDGQSLTGCRTVQLAPTSQRVVRCTRLHALREGDLTDGSPADCLRWAARLAGAVAAAVGQDADSNVEDDANLQDDVEEDSAEGGRRCPPEFGIRVRAGIADGASWSGSRRLPQHLLRSLEAALRPLLVELDRLLATEMALELVFARLPPVQSL